MRVPLHVVRERRERLAALLRQHAYLPVQELCRQLDISEATVRRDLVSLEQDDQIIRTFGGALTEFNQQFTPFRQRLKLHADAKERIAQTAAGLVKPDTTLYLDAGSTIYSLANQLALSGPRPLKVITISLPVAERLAALDQIEVHMPGGQWLADQSILLGPASVKAIAFYKIDLAIMGAEGLDPAGIWNSHEDVVRFQKAVLKNSTSNLFCIDQTKLTHSAPAKLASWNQVDTLITDATPDLLKQFNIKFTSKIITPT